MLYILHGADIYRSRKKMNEIIAEYRAKAGDFNLHRFDAEEDEPAAIKAALETNSLFAPKKFAVISYPFSGAADWKVLTAVFESVADNRDVIAVLYDRGLKGEAVKRLEKTAKIASKVQEFKPFTREQLSRWVRAEAASRKIALTPSLFAELLSCGPDLWKISNELDKLTVQDYRFEVRSGPAAETSIFKFGDAFFSSKREALRQLFNLLRAGEAEQPMFGYLANHTRSVLAVKHYAESGRAVPASAGIHPFVVKKASIAARNVPLAALRRTLRDFFEEDARVKIGFYKHAEAMMRLIFSQRV